MTQKKSAAKATITKPQPKAAAVTVKSKPKPKSKVAKVSISPKYASIVVELQGKTPLTFVNAVFAEMERKGADHRDIRRYRDLIMKPGAAILDVTKKFVTVATV